MTIAQITSIVKAVPSSQAVVTSSSNKVFIRHSIENDAYRKSLPAGCPIIGLVQGSLRCYQVCLSNDGIKAVYVDGRDPRLEIAL